MAFFPLILVGVFLCGPAMSSGVKNEKKDNDAPPVLSFATSNFNGFGVSCNGSTNGSIDLTVSGGLPPYTFQWSTGALTEDISSLAAGTYTVTVKDANNETSIGSATITQPAVIVVTLNGTTDVLCAGGNTGTADISVSGGVPTYTFLWSNGEVTQDATALSAGSSTVTVTDLNGCTQQLNLNINEPEELINSFTIQPFGCSAANGSITSNPDQGTPGYTYLWSTGATTQTISNLSTAGNYTVTITDLNGCTLVDVATLTGTTNPGVAVDSVKNVSCNGGTNGGIYITPSGAGPFTYLWSNGFTGQDLINVAAATYTVTVTDVNLCTVTTSATITQPTVITVTITPTNASCGNNNGAATANPGGGTGTFTYLWSTGATTQTINNLAPGTYTVTVTDQNLCTKSASATITNAVGPGITLVNQTNVSCNGGNNGAINISVSGGLPLYIFLWSNGAITEDISNLAAGTYTVTVTDVLLCTATQTFTITQPAVLNASVTPVNTTCGLSNGSVTANATGGTGTFTYLWNTGATTQAVSNIAAGTYTVTVTDQNLCTKTASGTVLSTGVPVISLVSVTNVSCNGGSNGGVNISVTGGTLPYSFLWSNGATTEDISGVVAGTYTVTVTDGATCTATQSFTVTQPTAITVTITPTNASCGNNNGAATANPGGGTGTFTYLWSTGATTQTINNLAPGTYTVTVTDQNLCTKSASATITNAVGPGITLVSQANVSCNGGNNGAINISVSGGLPLYIFLWSNGAITEDISNLAAGTYTVTVTDVLLCTATQTFTITQPAVLNASVTPVNTTCGLSNGSVTANATGGTGTFTYLWNTGATTQTVSNIAAGTYTVTVTDQNLCTKTASGTVLSTGVPVISLVSVTNVSCNGGSNGGVNISVTGGTLPYSFLWSNGATTEDISGVVAGTYTVTVTDGATCTATQSFTVTQPADITVTITPTNASCGNNNGAATANPGGGAGTFTYLWSTGATTQTINNLAPGTYTVTVTDQNLCTKSASATITNAVGPTITLVSLTNVSCNGGNNGAINISVSGGLPLYIFLWSNGAITEDISNLAAGTYTVTVTDLLLCTATQTFTITQPTAINASVTPSSASCGLNNGSVTANATGGTGTFTYLWNTGATTQTVSNTGPGTYTVTVTDQNLCTKTASGTVTNIPSPIVNVDSLFNPSCNGLSDGAIYLTVSGGTLPYGFSWSNGAVTDDIINLPAGSYTLTVSDGAGCSATFDTTLADPAVLNDSLNASNATCGLSNGSITVFPYGGTPAYTVLWSNGQASLTISNLSPATYTVTITDFNGCTKVDSVNISNNDAPVLNVDSIIEPECFGGTGSIYLSASGGVLPYSYLWSNGITDPVILNVAAGIYTCTVTGGNGCTSDLTVPLNQPSSISDSTHIFAENCGNDDGAATVFPYGGSPPYQFLWSSGETISTIFNKNKGTYIVTITDFHQCTFIDTVIIPEVSGAQIITDSVVNVLCNGLSTGAIYISTTGGLPPLQYQWSHNVITEDVTNLAAGVYSLTVTDSNGCTSTYDTVITEPAAINKSITTTPAGCNLSNGTATVTGAGGVPPYSYLWFNGSVQPTVTGLSSGTYTVTVTDANGCTAIDFALVSNTGGPLIIIDSVINNRCYGDSLGSVYTTITDGTPPYNLIWSNGKTGDDIFNLYAGSYTITVTDANNCVSIRDTVVTENQKIVATIVTTPANCGSATGTAVIIPSGGIPGYTYLWQLSGSTLPYQTNLPAGVYPVKITDNIGCTVDTAAVITSPGAPQITLNTITHVTCNNGDDGAININVSGGSPPYTYFWQNTFPAQTTQDATGLSAGTYVVNVTDTAGCSASFGFTVTEPGAVVITFTTNDPSCGNSNGSISSSVSGGNPGSYTYLWSTGTSGTGITNIGAGSYTLTITDSQGCRDSAVASLNNINGPEIIVTDSSHITCKGLNDGFITTQIINGTPPFTIDWDPGNMNTPNISNLSPGIYTLTVTDALGCVAVRSVEITEPDIISYNASIPIRNDIYNLTCHGSNDGSITLFVSGGTPFISSGFPQYNYFWTPSGATTQSISGLPAGLYTVNITDSLGCLKTASFTLTEPPFVSASAGTSFRICGTDSSSVSATVPAYGTGHWTVLNGTAFFGNPLQANTTVSRLSYGENTLAWVVSDGICTDTAFLVVTRDSIVQAFAGNDRDVCEPGIVLTATQPQFGTGTWNVIEGDGTVVSPNIAASPVTGMNFGVNIFAWTITNGNCIDDDTVRIIYNTPDECFEELEMPTGITPNGDGINDYFFVRGLDYNNNSIIVLNRWGSVIYEKDNYKNDWSGTNKTGDGLPDGTYYVILKVPSRGATLKGYVDIRR